MAYLEKVAERAAHRRSSPLPNPAPIAHVPAQVAMEKIVDNQQSQGAKKTDTPNEKPNKIQDTKKVQQEQDLDVSL